jgi:hypothetical protein
MNLGRLVAAAVVMAALGGLVWWSNKQEAAKVGQPDKDAPPKILTIQEDSVQQIEIKTRDGQPAVVKKDSSGNWELTAPTKLAADKSAVTGVLSSASSLSSERVVDENATDLASYGLDPAATAVTFTLADGKTTVLRIGDTTPTGSSVYAMVEGDKRLFTMSTYNKDSIAKSAGDLREKHLLTFEQDKLSRVEVAPAGKPAIEFGRTGQNEWQILKPRPLRADGWQVEDLLSRVKQVTLDPAVDEKKAASGFASAALVATVRVTGPDGVKSLEIRKSKEDVYAKSTTMPGVYKVNRDAADGLDKPLDDFRAKKVFDFGFTDPSRIEAKDGDKTLVVEKSGDKWTSAGKTMDSVSVQNLIDKLRDLSAAKFVESGFTTAAIDLTVVSNEGKRTEKVQIAPAGDRFLARRENDASLYQLEGDTIRDLRQSIDGVREPAPADGKKK